MSQTPKRIREAEKKSFIVGDFSIRYLLEIVFRRKRQFVIPFFIIPPLAVLLTFFLTPQYMSTTTILLGKTDILNPLVKYDTAVIMSDNDRLSSFQKIVYSRPVIINIIEQLGLESEIEGAQDYEYALEKLVDKIRSHIQIFALSADSFQIGCTAEDPVIAKKLVESVSNAFIEKSLKGSKNEVSVAVIFIQRQMEIYQELLLEAEDELQQFKIENIESITRIGSLSTEQEEMRQRITDLKVELKDAELNKELLESRLSGEQPMVVSQALFHKNTPYQAQYQRLEMQLGNLLATRTEGHPEVLKVKRELAYIKDLLEKEKEDKGAAETKEVRSPIYQEILARRADIKIEIEVLKMRISEYTKINDELKTRIKQIPNLEKKLRSLDKKEQIAREIYETLQVKLEHSKVSREVELEQQDNRFTIIDPPLVPLRPYKPNKLLIVIAGFMGAAFVSVGLIFMLEIIDPHVMRITEIEKLTQLPVIGTVPKVYIKNLLLPEWCKKFPFNILRDIKDTFTAQRFVLPVATKEELLKIDKKSGKTKKYHFWQTSRTTISPTNLKQLIIEKDWLDLSNLGKGHPDRNIQAYIERFRSTKIYAKSCYDTNDNLIWLTTSAKAGTGKTVFTANMAIVSAFDTDETVLLIDMSNNMTDSISSGLGLAGKKGILDYLSGNASFEEILYTTTYDNLTVIPRGTLPDNFKGSVFQSSKIKDMLKTIREKYNLTMIEIPDVLSNADSIAIIPETDGVFATVNLYYSKRGPLKAGIEKIQQDKVIGCIANYAEFWIPSWLYKWI